MTTSPLTPILEHQGAVVLDGGLATELEAQGFVLDSDLWSAELIARRPDAIEGVHTAYLEAGADVVVTASYQASYAGFRAAGRSDREAETLLRTATALAVDARDAFWRAHSHHDRARPLVAASVGPYGAYLANGAEFTGDYDVDPDGLRAFHGRRFAVLADTPADLLACETIPCLQEAEVYVALLREQEPGTCAWLSFSCRDDAHISDGTPIEQCGRLVETCEQVVAVGINCTAPRYLDGLIARLRTSAPSKEIVVYPNSGEDFDTDQRVWTGTSDPHDAGTAASAWHRQGARLIGGCCRTGPDHIRAIRRTLIRPT